MKKALKILWKIIWITAVAFVGSSLLAVLLFKFVNPPITPLMLIRLGEQKSEGEEMKLRKQWVSIDDISCSMQLAVVASEDNLFMEHHGFDFNAIEKARAFNDQKKGRRIHGGSTISQQTAKNVFLLPQRSWVRKGLETWFTFLIETIWGKKRIMEVYLNVIELGDGIYGVQAASLIYYHHPASQIRPAEAALLAAVLPNPRKWNPTRPTAYLTERQQWILWNMGNIGRMIY
ncbi:MAG TPA: monofunctional biosynthetic peptidoglycan transglycosylase [Bacteroidales bacterium]|nr:monofunctional biosynthetic peptidoglycan transglycosylase [Bacteroidales bacterium]